MEKRQPCQTCQEEEPDKTPIMKQTRTPSSHQDCVSIQYRITHCCISTIKTWITGIMALLVIIQIVCTIVVQLSSNQLFMYQVKKYLVYRIKKHLNKTQHVYNDDDDDDDMFNDKTPNDNL